MRLTRLGCDPGITGAIALLDAETHELIRLHDMPTATTRSGKVLVDAIQLAAVIRSMCATTAVIEQVGSIPGQGVVSTFSFGRSAGVLAGVTAALLAPVTYVTPQRWKPLSSLPVGSSKASSRKLAAALWPTWTDQFRLAKHDGRAEACLTARFG